MKESPHPNKEVLTEIRDILKEEQSAKEKSSDKKEEIKVRIK
ncbi:hypothetical protein [Alkalibacillus almallahensis]|nr:hypothetical protein [Alkalibacillus almallahensis]NIK12275.1 hypothetical protein [Alkalibacillus almallahensis]